MIKTLIIGLVCGYALVVVLVYSFQRSLMYVPSREALPAPEAAGVAEMAPIQLRTSDGLVLTSWYAPPNGQKQVVVLFHGNAGTLAGRAFKARYFLDAGYGVLLVGYRGFGENPGKPTEQGLYIDARTALRHMLDQGYHPKDIILYGESLGSGVATQMAWEQAGTFSQNNEPFAALILEAPFTSMGAAAANHYPWLPAQYLVKDRYDSLSKIDQIGTALYIMHGAQDRTVPQSHGRILFDQASEPKESHWIEPARHVDVYDFGAWVSLSKWLKTIK
ncbi:MAG: alpha/beta hydrolase [Rhodospirillales bacterium]|nr:alpha/beta hydrolase [Rhodospirillales bacterium]MBT4038629.1 alpha/beta hydrolase [Rhodospirillales bacterium]MBT4627611.1 alpha/beta hydrolase [Rhodospirillales bacterium]MBT5350647.1 alpha/beta hydrolase [Rhodospirillales bacterium]MBT5521504.1 alpha/beta hydrolase [Rhodospirillales bacterium]